MLVGAVEVVACANTHDLGILLEEADAVCLIFYDAALATLNASVDNVGDQAWREGKKVQH